MLLSCESVSRCATDLPPIVSSIPRSGTDNGQSQSILLNQLGTCCAVANPRGHEPRAIQDVNRPWSLGEHIANLSSDFHGVLSDHPIMRPLIANLNRRTRHAFARNIDKSNRPICSLPIQAVRVTWSQKRLGRSKWLDWSLVLRSAWSRTDHRRVTISINIKCSGRDSESPSSPSTEGFVASSTTGSLIVVDCSAIITSCPR